MFIPTWPNTTCSRRHRPFTAPVRWLERRQKGHAEPPKPPALPSPPAKPGFEPAKPGPLPPEASAPPSPPAFPPAPSLPFPPLPTATVISGSTSFVPKLTIPTLGPTYCFLLLQFTTASARAAVFPARARILHGVRPNLADHWSKESNKRTMHIRLTPHSSRSPKSPSIPPHHRGLRRSRAAHRAQPYRPLQVCPA
jgi:hypothetical protein